MFYCLTLYRKDLSFDKHIPGMTIIVLSCQKSNPLFSDPKCFINQIGNKTRKVSQKTNCKLLPRLACLFACMVEISGT